MGILKAILNFFVSVEDQPEQSGDTKPGSGKKVVRAKETWHVFDTLPNTSAGTTMRAKGVFERDQHGGYLTKGELTYNVFGRKVADVRKVCPVGHSRIALEHYRRELRGLEQELRGSMGNPHMHPDHLALYMAYKELLDDEIEVVEGLVNAARKKEQDEELAQKAEEARQLSSAPLMPHELYCHQTRGYGDERVAPLIEVMYEFYYLYLALLVARQPEDSRVHIWERNWANDILSAKRGDLELSDDERRNTLELVWRHYLLNTSEYIRINGRDKDAFVIELFWHIRPELSNSMHPRIRARMAYHAARLEMITNLYEAHAGYYNEEQRSGPHAAHHELERAVGGERGKDPARALRLLLRMFAYLRAMPSQHSDSAPRIISEAMLDAPGASYMLFDSAYETFAGSFWRMDDSSQLKRYQPLDPSLDGQYVDLTRDYMEPPLTVAWVRAIIWREISPRLRASELPAVKRALSVFAFEIAEMEAVPPEGQDK